MMFSHNFYPSVQGIGVVLCPLGGALKIVMSQKTWRGVPNDFKKISLCSTTPPHLFGQRHNGSAWYAIEFRVVFFCGIFNIVFLHNFVVGFKGVLKWQRKIWHCVSRFRKHSQQKPTSTIIEYVLKTQNDRIREDRNNTLLEVRSV